MIHAALPNYPVPSVGYAITAAAHGRMSLPVAPSAYIYSHFKHVSGVPAPEGVRGVSISKLKILDALIEQLNRIKEQKVPAFSPRGKMSEEQIDALINQYETQVRQASTAQTAAPYKSASPAPQSALFNLVA